MESKESAKRIAGALAHPETGEWMEFLYEESSPARRRKLTAHLAECPLCTDQVEKCREGMQALDQFELPAASLPKRSGLPLFRLAAAAAIVFAVALGFALGRRSSTSAEIESLRNSVARLEITVQSQQTLNYSNSMFAATAAANEETIRLLTDFTRSQDEKLLADGQAVRLTLQSFDARLAKLGHDLETVAINTQTGFQQTRQNLSELVAYFPVTSPPNQK
jgi:hypothetical protein